MSFVLSVSTRLSSYLLLASFRIYLLTVDWLLYTFPRPCFRIFHQGPYDEPNFERGVYTQAVKVIPAISFFSGPYVRQEMAQVVIKVCAANISQ